MNLHLCAAENQFLTVLPWVQIFPNDVCPITTKQSLCIPFSMQLSICISFVAFGPIVSKVWIFLDLKIKLKNILF